MPRSLRSMLFSLVSYSHRPRRTQARTQQPSFTAGTPSALTGAENRLTVILPVTNSGTATASNVEIDRYNFRLFHITLRHGSPYLSATYPVARLSQSTPHSAQAGSRLEQSIS